MQKGCCAALGPGNPIAPDTFMVGRVGTHRRPDLQGLVVRCARTATHGLAAAGRNDREANDGRTGAPGDAPLYRAVRILPRLTKLLVEFISHEDVGGGMPSDTELLRRL